jgi:hypothetical protein
MAVIIASGFSVAPFHRHPVVPAVMLATTPAIPPLVTIERSEAVAQIPEKITFFLTARHTEMKFNKAVLHYGIEQLSCQESEAQREVEMHPAAHIDVSWSADFKDSEILLPGMRLWWRWELTLSDGSVFNTDTQQITVQDQRHKWQSLKQGNLFLDWYQGDAAFGARLMGMLANSKSQLARDLGIEIDDLVHVTVYPSYDELHEALVETYEWTGAVALPEMGVILMAAQPGMDYDEHGTIAHELTHLAVRRLTFNCVGADLPTWLNEGLAERGEGPASSDAKAEVTAALDAGRLDSLPSLAGSFSAYNAQAQVQYAQSQLVVHFLVEEFGAEKLDQLLAEIGKGTAIDAAMESVYGFDSAGLDARWRKSLGYDAPAQSAATPIAATAIPTFALWTPPVQPSATPAPSATATLIPTATPTEPPQASPTFILINPAQVEAGASSVEPGPAHAPLSPVVPVIAAGLVILSGAVFAWGIKKRRTK